MGSGKKYDGYTSFQYLEPDVDYREFPLAPEFDRVAGYDLGLSEAKAARAERLLAENVAVSLHDHPVRFPEPIDAAVEYNRAGRQWTGYEGLSRSGLDAVFDNFMDGVCCITSAHGWKWTDVIHDLGIRLSDLAKQDFVTVAFGVRDIVEAHETGRLALVPGLEAATMIENEVDRIDVLYGFGVRQMGVAYSEANTLGSGLRERHDGGLTAFGERAIDRFNKLGMAIDVSHSGDRTSLDVIERSRVPVLITHAGARAVHDSPRMKPDEVIHACAERGGVIGIEAAPNTTLSRGRPQHDIEAVMDHFRYCVDLVGIEHVAFGPDTMFGDHARLHEVYAEQLSLAAVKGAHSGIAPPGYVAGIENPAEAFPNLVGWLVKNDYSDDEVRAVVGGNVMRVLGEIWL
jgi:membrane dipeptidase